jgi:omega-6 fatty acid desaturase (delta-12 desaturase)
VQSPTDLSRKLLRYCEPDMRRALFEVGITLVPLAVLWALMWWSLNVGYWLTLLLAIPAGGLLVRLFIIQHDCGHGAFFRQRAANTWVGRVLGVLTLTPFDYWKRNHAIHHATSSNLDRRGIGDIDLLTVQEYRDKSRVGRLLYRVYRSAWWGRPGCSCCSIGCPSIRCATAGGPGSAPLEPMRSSPWRSRA